MRCSGCRRTFGGDGREVSDGICGRCWPHLRAESGMPEKTYRGTLTEDLAREPWPGYRLAGHAPRELDELHDLDGHAVHGMACSCGWRGRRFPMRSQAAFAWLSHATARDDGHGRPVPQAPLGLAQASRMIASYV